MAHKTARVIRANYGVGASTTVGIGRVRGGTVRLPQNVTNERYIGGGEDNLYGLIEPRIDGLSFQCQDDSVALIAAGARGGGGASALGFGILTDGGGCP